MSTAEFPRAFAEGLLYRQEKEVTDKHVKSRLDPSVPQWWVMLLASTVALVTSGYLLVDAADQWSADELDHGGGGLLTREFDRIADTE
ncbi:hypothetical protein [Neorhodopirellula pilleata]|uniref:Uncharacterized protein n=1 Tax=Neorhodopirellula pilleata TaxID=2714738 RepID=A0A5C6A3K6_9BACT|nr:hypothetical protein [Neorhodopirellula pilleata]TWT92993.1 hypothetical protein Pla100_43090 [Neorhodopirellula pilleata]